LSKKKEISEVNTFRKKRIGEKSVSEGQADLLLPGKGKVDVSTRF